MSWQNEMSARVFLEHLRKHQLCGSNPHPLSTAETGVPMRDRRLIISKVEIATATHAAKGSKK